MLDLIEFSKAKFAVSESGTVIKPLIIKRIGTGDGIASVRVSLVSDSATVGRDVQRLVQTVTWENGDKTDKTIQVVPIPDNYSEVKESVFIKLSAIKGASYGSIRVASVDILDSINLVDSVQDTDLVQLVRGTEPVSLSLATFKDGLDVKGRPPIPLQIWDDNNERIEFFLDTVGGNDDNDGRSPTTAVKTWDKAISIVKEKRISWNWNTYLRIKGTLQAPLDLQGVYGDSGDWWVQGTLTLTNWTDDNSSPNWTLEGTSDWNTTKLAFITDNDYVTLAFYYATFVRNTLMVFDKIVTYFEDCTFKPATNESYIDFIFGQGWHEFYGTITLDNSADNPILQAFGTHCYITIHCDLLFTTDLLPGDNTVVRAGKGAFLNIPRFVCNTPNPVLVTLYDGAKAVLGHTVAVNFNRDNNSEIVHSFDFNDCQVTYHNFATLANGRYYIASSPRKGRLIEWNLRARTGNGTFQMDIGQGSPWGDALTGTFTNWEPRLNRSMNFDSPWVTAFNFFMNVSNSSNLTDVVIQMVWRDY